MAEVDNFMGKFVLTASENFDEYMKKIGVGYLMRTMANSSKPVVEISKTADDKIGLKTTTTFKTTDLVFKLNEPFDETTADGRTVRTTITLDGGRLIQKQQPIKEGDKPSEIVRYLEGNKLVTIVSCEDVKATRTYERQD